MRYFAKYDETGEAICFGVGDGGTEITREEHERLQVRARQIWQHTHRIRTGEADIADVPDDIRESVRRNADSIARHMQLIAQQDVDAAALADMLAQAIGDVSLPRATAENIVAQLADVFRSLTN